MSHPAASVDATTPRKAPPFFTTPVGTVTLAVIIWVLACVLAAAALIGLNQMTFADGTTRVLMTYIAFAPSTIAIVFSVVFLIIGAVRWAIFGRSAPRSVTLSASREMAVLESINQRLLLSETAKKITYRSEDMSVLRKTLREDIKRGDYEAALVLVSDLAHAYGQREESEDFRAEIEDARQKDQQEKIAKGIAQLEAKLAGHDFDAAAKEAGRLQRLYPEDISVADSFSRVAVAKDQYKHELERSFLLANEREEIDQALEIMQKLDKLLTHEEAEPFREVARGVVGKKRDNLGVQFKLAVHDREWPQAVAAGEAIIKQFPNTRMADEVRQSIDQLRANAAGQRGVDPQPPPRPASGGAAPATGISFTSSE